MALYRVIPAGDVKLVTNERGKKSFSLVGGPGGMPRYVGQKLQTKLRFFLGEWFRNTREGIPWFQQVYGQTPDLDIVRAVYLEVFRSIPQIASTPRLIVSFDKATFRAAIDFAVQLVDDSIIDVRQPARAFIFQITRP